MIKLITFDLWNTLIAGNSAIKQQREYRIDYIYNLLKENQFDIEKDKIDYCIKLSWDYFMTEWENRHYTPTSRAMMNIFFENMQLNLNDNIKNSIVNFMTNSLLDIEQKEINGIRDLLDNLHGKYHLAIISDTGFTSGKYLRVLLKKMDMYKYFSFFAFSDEIGVSKPHGRIFDYVLNYFNVLPGESIHIGDLLKTDVEGAIKKGMKSVHFTVDTFIKESYELKPDFSTERVNEILDYVISVS